MSYSIESSTYPATMLLTMTNVTAFPGIGQAIRTKAPYVLARPTIDDLIEDTNIRMYNLQPENPTARISITSSRPNPTSKSAISAAARKKLKSATSSSFPYLRRLRCTFDL